MDVTHTMKEYISINGKLKLITSKSLTHYICGKELYSKADVITDYHPLDDMTGKIYLFIVPFVNY